jgi:hypothetical protein
MVGRLGLAAGPKIREISGGLVGTITYQWVSTKNDWDLSSGFFNIATENGPFIDVCDDFHPLRIVIFDSFR